MGEKTVLPISRHDLDELRVELEHARGRARVEAVQRVCDLFWEALHCPPDLTWLQPSPQEM